MHPSRSKTCIAWLSVTVLGSLLAIGAVAQQTKRVDSNALKNSGKTGEEWLTYGLDYGETRFSPLKQIDATNVGRLGLAWVYDLSTPNERGTFARPEATPLMSSGTLYWIGGGIAFAMDARTGRLKCAISIPNPSRKEEPTAASVSTRTRSSFPLRTEG